MNFHFYSNAIARASRGVASGIFIAGLLLIGFGAVIIAFPEVFAFLAAVVFFIAGAGCAITALKIFLASRKLDKMDSDESAGYRNNVQIYTEEHYDL